MLALTDSLKGGFLRLGAAIEAALERGIGMRFDRAGGGMSDVVTIGVPGSAGCFGKGFSMMLEPKAGASDLGVSYEGVARDTTFR